jgi:AMMECR1 domain-containing protein
MKIATTKINTIYVAVGLCFMFYVLSSCGVNQDFVVTELDADKFFKRGSDVVTFDELKLGSKLYIQKCGNCHNLILPSKYTQAEWEKEYLTKEFEKAKVENKDEKKQITYFIFAKAKPK